MVASSPAPLERILACADYINHAIPTLKELDGALNRLLAARFISHVRGRFALAKAGRAALSKVSKPRKSLLMVWRELDKLIACPCCGPKLRSVRRQVTVSESQKM